MIRHAFVTLSSRHGKSLNTRLVLAMHKEMKFKHRHIRKMPRHALFTQYFLKKNY